MAQMRDVAPPPPWESLVAASTPLGETGWKGEGGEQALGAALPRSGGAWTRRPLPSGPGSGRVWALCLGCCVRVQSGNLPRAQHRVCGVPSGPVTPPLPFCHRSRGLATPWVADRVGVQAEQLAPGGLCPAKPHNEGFEGIKLRTGWF